MAPSPYKYVQNTFDRNVKYYTTTKLVILLRLQGFAVGLIFVKFLSNLLRKRFLEECTNLVKPYEIARSVIQYLLKHMLTFYQFNLSVNKYTCCRSK